MEITRKSKSVNYNADVKLESGLQFTRYWISDFENDESFDDTDQNIQWYYLPGEEIYKDTENYRALEKLWQESVTKSDGQ